MIKWICLLLIFCTCLARADESETLSLDSTETSEKPAETSTVKVSKPKVTRTRLKYHDWAFGPITWQEDIKATRTPYTTPIQMQSVGLRAAYSYNRFFSTSWRYHHSTEFAFGNIKGQGTIPQIQDVLRDQAWFMGTYSPGLMVRTSPVSEVGFGLPLSYRYIKWHLQKDSNFAMDRGSSFSAGVSGTYVNRFTSHSSLQIMVQQQHMWNTVMWALAYSYIF